MRPWWKTSLDRKCLGISYLLYSEQRGILGDSSVVLRFVLNTCLMGQCHVLVVFSPHVAFGDMCVLSSLDDMGGCI